MNCAIFRATAKPISRRSKQRERTRTGIGSLKVRFNNVFGYYIEISKANMHLAPADYERKQTLVNAERFTTPELKELEGKILEAEEKILTLEREIFETLRVLACVACGADQGDGRGDRGVGRDGGAGRGRGRESLHPAAVFASRARCGWWRGRHPVIEKLTERDAQRFIPNDHLLSSRDRIHRRDHRARTWAASRPICGRPRCW